MSTFFAELDASGAHVKSQGLESESGDAIAVDPAGGVIYGGSLSPGIFLMRQER